jgi:hypothetical protein
MSISYSQYDEIKQDNNNNSIIPIQKNQQVLLEQFENDRSDDIIAIQKKQEEQISLKSDIDLCLFRSQIEYLDYEILKIKDRHENELKQLREKHDNELAEILSQKKDLEKEKRNKFSDEYRKIRISTSSIDWTLKEIMRIEQIQSENEKKCDLKYKTDQNIHEFLIKQKSELISKINEEINVVLKISENYKGIIDKNEFTKFEEYHRKFNSYIDSQYNNNYTEKYASY